MTWTEDGATRRDDVQQLVAAMLANNRVEAIRVADRVLAERGALACMEELAVPALEQLGRGWEAGNVALSQLYVAGRMSEELAQQVLARSPESRRTTPRVAVAVLEDRHSLGLRLVSLMLRAEGYTVLDLGAGWKAPALAARAKQDGVQVLLVSVLTLRAAMKISDLKDELDKLGGTTRLGVGGAPFRLDENLWKQVRADAYGRNAADALAMVPRLGGLT